ncbi:MAG: hypothetical protein IKQ69_01410 [Oscillospiraceae bacterium]|nr:hypothetical protein [Oscillospiraceae bacterium]
MMRFFHSWILSLTGASLIVAIAERLTPPGAVKRVTKCVCGVMLCAVMLRPAIALDRDSFARALAEYRSAETELLEGLEAREKELLRPYIEERTRTYILDEAQRLGIRELRCAVTVKWREGSWVPYEVELSGPATAEQRRELGNKIDAELGVPAERQRWNAA